MLGVEPHVLRALEHLGAGLADGLAHLQGEHPGGLLDIGLHDVRGGVHPLGALCKCRVTQRDSGVGGLGDATRHLGVVVGFEGFHGLARGRVHGCDCHVLGFSFDWIFTAPRKRPRDGA